MSSLPSLNTIFEGSNRHPQMSDLFSKHAGSVTDLVASDADLEIQMHTEESILHAKCGRLLHEVSKSKKTVLSLERENRQLKDVLKSYETELHSFPSTYGRASDTMQGLMKHPIPSNSAWANRANPNTTLPTSNNLESLAGSNNGYVQPNDLTFINTMGNPDQSKNCQTLWIGDTQNQGQMLLPAIQLNKIGNDPGQTQAYHPISDSEVLCLQAGEPINDRVEAPRKRKRASGDVQDLLPKTPDDEHEDEQPRKRQKP